jgi:carbon storage regulator CsrA
MLVLSRHCCRNGCEESIVMVIDKGNLPQIQQEIEEKGRMLVEVSVVDIRGDKARLGIKAPDCIPVHRNEIFERIQQEGRTDTNKRTNQIPEQIG